MYELHTFLQIQTHCTNTYSHNDSIYRHKFHYFADPFNFLDIGAVLFPLLIIPFRITNLSEQWIFASLGYLSQALRGFKYAAVFRYTS